MQSLGGMLFRTEVSVFVNIPVWIVEQSEAVFQAQHTGNGVVNPAHGHFAFLHKFLKVSAEAHLVWHHRHVYAGVDGYFYGLFLCRRDVVARAKVVYVGPVGHDKSVPVKVFFQPFGKQFAVGVERHAVVNGRVDHHRQRACTHCGQVRGKMLLAEVAPRYGRGRAVFA